MTHRRLFPGTIESASYRGMQVDGVWGVDSVDGAGDTAIGVPGAGDTAIGVPGALVVQHSIALDGIPSGHRMEA